ncbi:hypothetical protein BV22DRAFT_1050779 [Leucogyrophana mollusca]|uniref:Uncharacterized protein n=1 Tax=Leucogyrophana mollusca TaxID=85980 RepID=A0ACB8B2F0_9AGAM|nr:hypothetical protein BV22DRAFT_1050779 [Leucogyrophana mollusca]
MSSCCVLPPLPSAYQPHKSLVPNWGCSTGDAPSLRQHRIQKLVPTGATYNTKSVSNVVEKSIPHVPMSRPISPPAKASITQVPQNQPFTPPTEADITHRLNNFLTSVRDQRYAEKAAARERLSGCTHQMAIHQVNLNAANQAAVETDQVIFALFAMQDTDPGQEQRGGGSTSEEHLADTLAEMLSESPQEDTHMEYFKSLSRHADQWVTAPSSPARDHLLAVALAIRDERWAERNAVERRLNRCFVQLCMYQRDFDKFTRMCELADVNLAELQRLLASKPQA